ncbi:hypothetical protein B5G26_12645 [Anaerotignum lactatifermentans]|uniref:Uncharacterized protein n=1 Tax=Anaerotignum lactatifermentans TaxID=160404 RepID=A0A1Y3TXA4_9FIRM|nr:hypothetical protein [Anaerotignum lactatifermentans]OUN41083.1 hypothetical protein B5G26_12645 [Anaerotignum lactatifermentans]
MSIDNILSIIISILGSSLITLVLSTFIFIPKQEKQKYIFDEKKRVYDSIVIFAQIVLYPKEARYSLGVARYNIQELSEQENVQNALNDLKMAIPKIRLITKDKTVVESVISFIEYRDKEHFDNLIFKLQKDLYK